MFRGLKTLATPEKSAPAYGLPSTDFSASILTPWPLSYRLLSSRVRLDIADARSVRGTKRSSWTNKPPP